MKLAQKWCVGKGLEIGGASYAPLGVDALNVQPFPGHPVFEAEEIRLMGRVLPVDIEAFADDIPVADDSQDFVISSHVLEHVANVVAAFVEWHRVIRPGGIVFMIVPHVDRTFDAGRPVTPLAHIIEDWQTRRTEHLPCAPEGHRHVWRTADLVEVVDWCNEQSLVDWEIVEVEDVDSRCGNGFTIVCRKNPPLGVV